MDANEIIYIIGEIALDIINQLRPHSFFSAGDVIALVAIGGAVITTIMLNRASHKNSISSARIDWIQNVRESTAKFTSACYEVIAPNNGNENNTSSNELREKAHLLILYFGPEDEKSQPVELLCEASNSGKNEKIVTLVTDIKTHMINEKRQVWGSLQKHKVLAGVRLEEYYGIEDTGHPPSPEEHYETEIKYIEKQTSVYKELFDKLDLLNDAMRVYLKLEWNKAKKGR